MSTAKTERLLNLVICLLSTRRALTKAQIRQAVPQYAENTSTEAFERMFERDKDELRDLGIPLVTSFEDPLFEDEVGYRVDRDAYALPEVSFEPDELAVLGLAARVWQQASLAGPASRALQKLKAAGVEPDDAGLAGVETRVRTSEPAFEALYAAVRDRRPVTFPYRAGRAGELVERHLDPWGIVSWHGRWYVVGHDRRREARRVFRLSRIAGPVRPVGAAGDVQVPEGGASRSGAAVTRRHSPRETATVSVRPGSGVALRRRATEERRGLAAEGWDELTVGFADPESFAQEIVAYGPDVVVVQPAAVRDAVVRRLQSVLESV